ncbi:hypothetical protein IJ380_00925 [Candidatus Saccharibacteria bacterium]|nr:hypothetical protein [Candidatus Saccharibacteria bacterium]
MEEEKKFSVETEEFGGMSEPKSEKVPEEDPKEKTGSGWKVAVAILSVVAFFGVAFGIYGMLIYPVKLAMTNCFGDFIENASDFQNWEDFEDWGENFYNELEDEGLFEGHAGLGIDKRLYSINSDLDQQRYYLLIDDATYDMNQNFLDKKTYILDMDMTEGNELIREVDLASVFRPVVEEFFNGKENTEGDCSVEYFSPFRGEVYSPQFNYDTEVPFKAYYRCVDGNAERSFGSVVYAYDVENNTIRSIRPRT